MHIIIKQRKEGGWTVESADNGMTSCSFDYIPEALNEAQSLMEQAEKLEGEDRCN